MQESQLGIAAGVECVNDYTEWQSQSSARHLNSERTVCVAPAPILPGKGFV
jgi:hypothetical protein